MSTPCAPRATFACRRATRPPEVPIPPFPHFAQQVGRLVELGHPALAGLDEPAFRDLLEPLRERAEQLDAEPQHANGVVPYVVVLTRDVVAPEDAVPLLRVWGVRGPGAKPGTTDAHHGEEGLAAYRPTEGNRPPARAYLAVGVERGEEFCDVPPEDATATVLARGRSPLTVEEGVALLTQVPRTLEPNKCFSLAGSRRLDLPGDRRVPALWISGGAVKLGWCWAGNPHSWLGLASLAARVA